MWPGFGYSDNVPLRNVESEARHPLGRRIVNPSSRCDLCWSPRTLTSNALMFEKGLHGSRASVRQGTSANRRCSRRAAPMLCHDSLDPDRVADSPLAAERQR
jgi:hypothetical protein